MMLREDGYRLRFARVARAVRLVGVELLRLEVNVISCSLVMRCGIDVAVLTHAPLHGLRQRRATMWDASMGCCKFLRCLAVDTMAMSG